MIMLRKWNINESHWSHSLKASSGNWSHTHGNILKSRVLQISSKKMLTSLISFSSRNTFSLETCYLMRALFTLMFVLFFLCGQPYRFRGTSETSELVSTTENFSASTWFIHVDGLSNYLLSFQKNPSANFFKNNCCFTDQKHVGHYTNRFSEKGLDFYIKYLLRTI